MIVAIHGGGFTLAYFDCDGFSLVSRAAAAGCSVLGIDRPGYGESPRLPEGDRAIPRNANLLQAAIGQVWRERDLDAAGIVLVGHSIGSAVALDRKRAGAGRSVSVRVDRGGRRIIRKKTTNQT